MEVKIFGVKYWLIKLAGKEDQEKGFPWAIYEYNKTFTEKVKEAPFIVKEIHLKNESTTQKVGSAYFMATTGEVEFRDEGVAWIV
jgi:hypothetical protein